MPILKTDSMPSLSASEVSSEPVGEAAPAVATPQQKERKPFPNLAPKAASVRLMPPPPKTPKVEKEPTPALAGSELVREGQDAGSNALEAQGRLAPDGHPLPDAGARVQSESAATGAHESRSI